VADELRRFGVVGRAHLTSFDTSVLDECGRHAPEVARLVSVNAAWADKQGGLETFLTGVADRVDIVAIHHELMDAEWELIWERMPLERLCVWTVNDEAGMRHWLARGIGHLTSDSPDLALALRSSRLETLTPTGNSRTGRSTHSFGDSL
jgi:glycerophosphoryl diester phosphodiesterase